MNKTLRWRLAILASRLPPITRHVLLTLSVHMNDDGGSCFPSTLTQAAETGLSERSVITHLKKAVEAGFLKKRSRGQRGARWKANEYIAILPKSAEPRSVLVSDNQAQATEPYSVHQEESTEHDSGKVLNHVQSSSSDNSTQSINEYFWSGEVIKLNEKDFRTMQQGAGVGDDAFAEYLENRDGWLATRSEAEQARWFISTSHDLQRQFRKSNTYARSGVDRGLST